MNPLRKRLMSRIALMAVCILSVFNSNAQLSGTKVIGTAPSDYATFTAAVSALTSQGISASVVFEVKPGTYNERITIGDITGASATKTITFRSQGNDSSAVTLSYASSGSATDNFVVFLDNADYIKFSYLTIQRTGTSNYAQVIEMSNGATYNTFEYCNIKGTTAVSTTTFTALVGSSNTLEDSYNNFLYNTFSGGSYGLNYLGRGSSMLDPGLVITGNLFKNQVYRGIYITNQDGAQIANNRIITNTANTGYNGIYGMYANNDTRILKNKLELSTGYGIYLTNSAAAGVSVILVANNFISVAGSSTNYGLFLNQLLYANIYYNSVNLTTAPGGRACNISGASTTSIDLLNNSFVNVGGGYAMYVDANTVTPLLQCDNNNLYTTGTNLGYWQASGNQINLAAWRTNSTFDATSISVNPQYVSATNLHVGNGALNAVGSINLNLATPVADDIDGQSRNSLRPDIGADEFNIEDIGVCALQLDPSYCQGTTASIRFYIKNFTDYDFQGTVPVHYQINGGTTVNATTGNLFIGAHDSTFYFFPAPAALPTAGVLPIICGTGLVIDVNTANDDLTTGTINVVALPIADAGDDVYVCLGDSATLTATGGGTYSWNTTPVQTNATIHVLASDTTDYIVTVTTSGCSSTDTVSVIPGNFPKPVADFTYVPSDMHYYFTDISTDATGWNWDFGDFTYSTLQDPEHIYGSNNNYNVTLIAYNGCDSDTVTKTITVYGIEEEALAQQLSFTPNPAVSQISISMNGTEKISAISILDITGKMVLNIPVFESEIIDISALPAGTYIILAKVNAYFVRKTLVIQR